jgi:hypothetical protein
VIFGRAAADEGFAKPGVTYASAPDAADAALRKSRRFT